MQMFDPKSIRNFALAGRATLILKSQRSGTHFTYKIKAPRRPDDPVRFVSVLVQPDTYAYIGMIKDGKFSLTQKSQKGLDAPSVKAMGFFCETVLEQQRLPQGLEVRHEGRCGRCNRELTHPESIDRGIGPECWKHFGG